MTASQRFLALDVFRGITICFMIVVNSSGNGEQTFAPLLHANWHGFTPTDLVFPSFLFAVGNAMSFVLPRWAGSSTNTVVWKIVKRTVLIFLLGYLLYWFPFFENINGSWQLKPISQTRILGVLQRIALCYGIASLLIYFLKPRTVIIVTLIFLVAYKVILTSFGDLTLEGNVVLKFDQWLMGESHLYTGEGIAFDPEGWLSTLPSIGNTVAGYFVGRYVQSRPDGGSNPIVGKSYEGLTHLLLIGTLLIAFAYFWDSSFPINKKLWTSSFVLYTVGLDMIILAAIIYVLDILKKTRWAYFFEVFGKNPLFIYLLSELGLITLWLIPVGNTNLANWIFKNFFNTVAPPYWSALLFALTWMIICWLFGWWMDKKKIYIRV